VNTYRAIQDNIKKKHGRVVKTCWIAHVKELNGLNPRNAPNRQSPTRRVHPCPPDVRPLIEAEMRRLGLLS
jgi:hypothetical protein